MNSYCLPIIKFSKSEVLEQIETHQAAYSYFEVWLDYVRDLDEAFVRELTGRLQGQLVVVFRRQGLEAIHMKLEERLAFLRLFDGTPVLVDLDLDSQEPELDYIRQHKMVIQSVVSYHNYDLTPDGSELRQIVARMEAYAPAVYKVSAMCQTEHDAVRLLGLLLSLKAAGRRYIVLGMGEPGVVTRIFGTLWGNTLVFAPETIAESSAPGQLTRAQLDSILSTLKG